MKTDMNTQGPRQRPRQTERAFPKTDMRYWLTHIEKRVNGKGQESPYYSMSLKFETRRLTFSLHTNNQQAAAKRARAIWLDLTTIGAEAALAKHRPKAPEPPPEAATIGAWIDAARKVFDREPRTFGSYVRCLRTIASDIQKVTKSKKRFAPKNAGDYRRKIDAAPLDILTPAAIQNWRIEFVKKAGQSPDKQRSARTSANSMMRQAASIFSKRILKFIEGVQIPSPAPFDGCEFYSRENMRYVSRIDPAALLQKAEKDLRAKSPEAFKAILLAFAAGLRRAEIDRLLWRQIDLKAGVLHIMPTEAGDLKTAYSSGDVPIDDDVVAILREFKEKAKGKFVLECSDEELGKSHEWGTEYRCNAVWEETLAWLRANGLDVAKPLHTLRKEAGSQIATESGIFAASRFLRHADIQVTSAFYAEHKARTVVPIAKLRATQPPSQTQEHRSGDTEQADHAEPNGAGSSGRAF